MNPIQHLNRLFYRPRGGPLPDWRIAQLVKEYRMIDPFYPTKQRLLRDEDGDIVYNVKDRSAVPIISRGLGHYSYDMTLSPKEFLVFRNNYSSVVDPKDFDPECLGRATLESDKSGSYFILPAHTYALGFTAEYQRLPNNVTALYIGKSTYARAGIIVNTTPGEAGWEGYLTVEISNSSGADVRIYVGEGICAALFFEGVQSNTTYGRGKYQGQGAGVTFARV